MSESNSTERQAGGTAHGPAGSGAAAPPLAQKKSYTKASPKRGNWVARQVHEPDSGKVPACATSSDFARVVNKSYYVPVSFVAKDWRVSPRRIRSLLAEKRLEGRQQENGYWEVIYPYRFVIGTRGPVLKRQQGPKVGRPKRERSAE